MEQETIDEMFKRVLSLSMMIDPPDEEELNDPRKMHDRGMFVGAFMATIAAEGGVPIDAMWDWVFSYMCPEHIRCRIEDYKSRN